MADLIPSNDEQQEMAKQVEAIAEAAAQRDSQIAQMLNLVPKAAALSTAASRAISFTKKTWVDDPTSGTPITAADMNRLEQAIVDLNTTITSVQNSLSQYVTVWKNDSDSARILAYPATRMCLLWLAEYQHPRTVQPSSDDVICTVPEGYRPSPGARYEGVVMDNNLSLGVLAIGLVGNANVELRTLADELYANQSMRGFVCWPY